MDDMRLVSATLTSLLRGSARHCASQMFTSGDSARWPHSRLVCKEYPSILHYHGLCATQGPPGAPKSVFFAYLGIHTELLRPRTGVRCLILPVGTLFIQKGQGLIRSSRKLLMPRPSFMANALALGTLLERKIDTPLFLAEWPSIRRHSCLKPR